MTFHSFGTYVGSVNNVLATSSITYRDTHPLSRGELSSLMLRCSVSLYFTALLKKTGTQVLRIADGCKFLIMMMMIMMVMMR